MNISDIDFKKINKIAQCNQEVIPAIAQDYHTGDVLIVGYANKEALLHTLSHKIATFWSTSRNELWIKGATSGDFLDVLEVRLNCEENALLYRVVPQGKGACHTYNASGTPRKSCFYQIITSPQDICIDPLY